LNDGASATEALQTGYAPVNGLRMYYEIHGAGGESAAPAPALLLHGAYLTTGDFGPFLPALAATRRVIVPDMQAHGRTADADRPITYEGLADDAAGLLEHLGIRRADVVGYSMGGAVAMQVAIRHPEVVRKLVSISASSTSDAMQPELIEMIPTITPEMFAGSPRETTYKEVAPDPGQFPTLVEKLKTLHLTPFAWPDADIQGIAAPTMIVMGDADAVRPEHAVELFRLRGGGGQGDLAGLSPARLAILPGTTHFIPPGRGMLDRHEWLIPMITAFLDEQPSQSAGTPTD
jgi:pimeloyl-ACP methyl ester carboxylesterase